jgi:hypothetical protein
LVYHFTKSTSKVISPQPMDHSLTCLTLLSSYSGACPNSYPFFINLLILIAFLFLLLAESSSRCSFSSKDLFLPYLWHNSHSWEF